MTARLGHGPTPRGDSIKPTRKSVRIASATAGSNAADAGKACDDNEATGWKSDGKAGNGWIEFKLERPANVNQLVLKTDGFRRRAYPVRVTVDGAEVFKGTTPKSLGYVTLPLKPAVGQTVRVELIGAIDDQDAFGLVEVAGTAKPSDDAAVSRSKGALEIIEAEVYGPVTEAAK